MDIKDTAILIFQSFHKNDISFSRKNYNLKPVWQTQPTDSRV